MRARRARSKFADPFEPGTFAGPLINKAALEKVERYNQLAIDEGAEVLIPGGRMTDLGPCRRLFHLAVCLSSNEYRPECVRTIRAKRSLSPHVALQIPFADDDEAIRIYNDTPYGLSDGPSSPTDYRRWRVVSRQTAITAWATSTCPASAPKCICRLAASSAAATANPRAAALRRSAVTHKTARSRSNHDPQHHDEAQGMTKGQRKVNEET